MCLYPKLVDNPKCKANKKNGGKVPPVKDERVLKVPIGCGYCRECKKQKANGWRTRLHEEFKENRKAVFVTLTFSDESLAKLEEDLRQDGCELEGYQMDNAAAVLGMKRFVNRWYKKFKKKPRRWMVTELGSQRTERIHWHGLIWEECTQASLEDIWKYGNVWIGEVRDRVTVNYIVKYISKPDLKHPYYKPRILCSPGIGRHFKERLDFKKTKENKREYFRLDDGRRVGLPIYYRNAAFDEETREELWLDRLDQEVRYVMGKEIDVSGDLERYNLAVETARQLNRFLGYGDDQNFSQVKYEKQWRELLRLKRAQKVHKTGF